MEEGFNSCSNIKVARKMISEDTQDKLREEVKRNSSGSFYRWYDDSGKQRYMYSSGEMFKRYSDKRFNLEDI